MIEQREIASARESKTESERAKQRGTGKRERDERVWEREMSER